MNKALYIGTTIGGFFGSPVFRFEGDDSWQDFEGTRYPLDMRRIWDLNHHRPITSEVVETLPDPCSDITIPRLLRELQTAQTYWQTHNKEVADIMAGYISAVQKKYDDVIDSMNGFAAEHLAAYEVLLAFGVDVFDDDYTGRDEYVEVMPELAALFEAESASRDKIYRPHANWKVWLMYQKEIAWAFNAVSVHPTVAYAMKEEQAQYDYDAAHGWYDEED